MKIEDLIRIVEATVLQGKISNKKFKKICIDSRTVKKGDLFIAIIGKRLDGHQYISEALKKEPVAILVSNSEVIIPNKTIPVLYVPDTNQALIQLGTYFRQLYPIPVIAVTGSVGKTTTKNLIADLLATKFNVLRSPQNYNNRIGLPLTLFELKETDQVMVVELGMNHLGEISELSCMCRPNVAVITKIGTSHIGYVKGRKNILKAKLEILDGMSDGYLVVNGFDPYLKKIKLEQIETLAIGRHSNLQLTDVQIYVDGTYFNIVYHGQKYPAYYPVPGEKMLENVLLAIQVALLFQVPLEQIVEVLRNYQTDSRRLEKTLLPGGITLIDDCYNASIESLENDLSILNLVTGKKLLIFGDFLELGRYAKKIHRQAARKIRRVKGLDVLLIGEETKVMRRILKGAPYFKTAKEAICYLQQQDLTDRTILVKGSRKVGLEEVVTYLQEKKTRD